jgi:Na+/H+ antiporter NhaD/arsenite permease-like protein
MAIVLIVLASGIWNGAATLAIGLGIELPVSGLIRDATLIAIALLSWKTTKHSIRVENCFTWAPMQEVAILFAAIFITMIPMLAMLKAGAAGPFGQFLTLVSGPDGQPVDAAYFWLTGLLSSFLDNAPTYLVFFNLAGGDPQELMGPLASTLLAISAGAVFMGANTYIGNAPNFMVRSICEERGVRMPSFLGYMLWSGAILLPLFAVVTLIWFR